MKKHIDLNNKTILVTGAAGFIESNLIKFYNILEACRHNPTEHLVYASSSSVYGSNKKVPYFTDDKADNPVSLYDATEPLEKDYVVKPNPSLRDGLRKFSEWYKEFYK